eukprot:TRINITY_DN884_c0_g6_i2.p1 TRINITY_DN884_c0_g6~~TRINITY_DN884_c0_g6_i2.p1  ORF type:complete len:736 (+),score=270.25 TRINITY_DN884_c0_g6_i2:116-2209(+)
MTATARSVGKTLRKEAAATTDQPKATTAKPPPSEAQPKWPKREITLEPMFKPNTVVLADIYVTSEPELRRQDSPMRTVFFTYGQLSAKDHEAKAVTLELDFPADDVLQRNTSLYLHLSMRDVERAYLSTVRTHRIIRYRRPQGSRPGYRYLAASYDDQCDSANPDQCEAGEVQEPAWEPVLQNKVVFSAVHELQDRLRLTSLPDVLGDMLQPDYTMKMYHPLVWENKFWLRGKHYTPLNSTVETVTVDVSIEGISIITFSLYKSLDLYEEMGLTDASDTSTLKQLLQLDPWVLVSIVLVGILHTFFNILAFKNDVTFWRQQKSLKGQSVTALYVRAGMQTVILLYLLDHDNTSRVVLFNFGIGVAIEFWKIAKAHSLQVHRALEGGDAGPQEAEAEEEDKIEVLSLAADRTAGYYLFLGIAPLIILYSMYSLVYHEHKGVYSFVLTTLVRFIYWFGFVMMTPQLFVNYKLKSVAYMPWRAFTYKAIGTFIDDIFAFAIEMPTAHRLACLRDDFIFVIYIYQYWVYNVDHSRINEFGQWPLLALSQEELVAKKSELQKQIADAEGCEAEAAADASNEAAAPADGEAELASLKSQLQAVEKALEVKGEMGAAVQAASDAASQALEDAPAQAPEKEAPEQPEPEDEQPTPSAGHADPDAAECDARQRCASPGVLSSAQLTEEDEEEDEDGFVQVRGGFGI